jgi:hypothetical protein
MPRLIRRNAHRRGWNQDHIFQLAAGWDYTCSAWGDPVHPRGICAAEDWPPADVLEDMRACWQAHSADVKAIAKRHGNTAWGELVFERRMTPQEAFDFRSPYAIKE